MWADEVEDIDRGSVIAVLSSDGLAGGLEQLVSILLLRTSCPACFRCRASAEVDNDPFR